MLNRIKLILNNGKLMKRIGFTLLVLLVYKVGTYIPIPLLNVDSLQDFIRGNGFLEILNTFTGDALGRFSILALGISPYITASIVIQLLQMDIVPILKEWSEQGETGKQKINQVTRYAAVILAFIQGMALLLGLSSSPENPLQLGVDNVPVAVAYIYMSLIIAAGTAFMMWLADLITKKGIGNGTSMLIVAGILTSLPSMMIILWNKYIGIPSVNFWSIATFILVVLLYVGILIGVVYLELAKRRIPIQYANRQGKSDSNIPIKLNSAGVIPVIFASTILSVPMSIVGFTGASANSGLGYWINQVFNYTNPLGFMIYVILIYVFTFFYAFLTINPEKIADNLQKSNAYIPGVRPGLDTQNFIGRLLFKITLIGATYLALLAIIPIITARVFNFTAQEASAVTIGGTSLLIIVGVAIETTKQVEADANERQYSGFLK